MAVHPQALTIRQVPWDDAATSGLRISAGDDMPLIAADVKRGAAQLWRCRVGQAVTRVELTGNGAELVIVLFEGCGLIEALLPVLLEEARKLGIKSARAHIKRRGLLRIGARYGFELDHYVIRKQI